MAVWLGMLAVWILMLAGCQPDQPATVALTPTLSATVEEREVNTPAGADEEIPQTARPTVMELRVWLPEFLGITSGEAGSTFLDVAIDRFEQAHPGVRIITAIKAESGRAGLLNYMQSANRAAPTVLPDMVLLNSQDLWQAAAAGLVQPMTLPQPGSYYPFALQAVSFEERTYGLPYSADLVHAVFHRAQLPQIPATWDELLDGSNPYLFVGAARDVQHTEMLLLNYLSAGGSLSPTGVPDNPVVLEAVFDFLAAGVSQKVIPEEVPSLASMDAVWAFFLDNPTSLAATYASLYLGQREVLDSVGYASIPSPDGTPWTVAQVWALGLVTLDPERQELSMEFMADLVDPAIHAGWNQVAHHLPTRPIALAQWDGSQDYYQFLGELLERAVALPNGQPFVDSYRHALQLQRQVLTGELPPRDAVSDIFSTP